MTGSFGRFLRHNAIALLALFIALSGTSAFAAATLINGSTIKPHTIAKNRLTNTAIKQLHGAKGAQGPPGVQGVQGVQGPQGLISTTVLNNTGGTVPNGTGTNWVYIGTPKTVTVAAGQSLAGAAEVPLQVVSGTSQIDYGLCYQASGGGALTSFSNIYSTSGITTTKQVFAGTEAVAPGTGSWNVGFCIRNNTGVSVVSDWVNGWVNVVNGPVSARPIGRPSK